MQKQNFHLETMQIDGSQLDFYGSQLDFSQLQVFQKKYKI